MIFFANPRLKSFVNLRLFSTCLFCFPEDFGFVVFADVFASIVARATRKKGEKRRKREKRRIEQRKQARNS